MGIRRRAVVLILAALPFGPASAASPPVGQVAATKGAVFRESGGRREPVRKGTALAVGDVVVTEAGGKAKLLLNDGTIISLGENARLDIAQYQSTENAYTTRLRAEQGAMRFLFQRALDLSRFEIETETAVAAVRGTQWLMDVKPGHTAVALLGGAVAVRALGAPGGEVVLSEPGQGTDVRAGAAPTPPAVWGGARFAATLARASFED
jgi:hypothetical protein